jgi:WD40 repeat protein
LLLQALPQVQAARRGAQDSYSPINSLDFHLREDLLVTAGDDDAIKLYSVNTGEHKQTNYSRKYGAAHVCFTHHERAVIYASNKVRRAARAGVPRVTLCSGEQRFAEPGAAR